MQIPGVVYSTDHPATVPRLAWQAGCEAAHTAADLAMQIRTFDSQLQWDGLSYLHTFAFVLLLSLRVSMHLIERKGRTQKALFVDTTMIAAFPSSVGYDLCRHKAASSESRYGACCASGQEGVTVRSWMGVSDAGASHDEGIYETFRAACAQRLMHCLEAKCVLAKETKNLVFENQSLCPRRSFCK